MSKQWLQDGPRLQEYQNGHILMEKPCVIFSGIRKVLYRYVNILKYSTVISNSNVILPKLKANLCKLGSELRMKNVVLQHDHV